MGDGKYSGNYNSTANESADTYITASASLSGIQASDDAMLEIHFRDAGQQIPPYQNTANGGGNTGDGIGGTGNNANNGHGAGTRNSVLQHSN